MFNYRTYSLRRTIPLAILLIVLTIGVFFYARYQETIANFRPYYYKTYVAAIKYSLTHKATPAPTGSATSVPVLLYHGVITNHPDGANTLVDSFIEQMLALKQAGYHTVSMDDYYDFIYNGKQLPAKSFLLTFDDGRKDSYYPAQPLLHALGYRATMFVITSKSLGEKDSVYYLSKTELQEMKTSGNWDIQAHTYEGHDVVTTDSTGGKAPFFANKLWLSSQNRYETDAEYRTRVHDDLSKAKSDIVGKLGITPVAFAVPFGDIGDNVTNYSGAKQVLLHEISGIFPLAFYQFAPGRAYSQNYRGSKRGLDIRIEPKQDWNSGTLLEAIRSSNAKDLPYSAVPKTDDGWLTPWGTSFTSPNGLKLLAGANTNGATTNLDGSYGWKDYQADVTVSLQKGDNFRVLMRQQDISSYIACSYSHDTLQLQQVVNGNATTLAKQTIRLDLTKPLFLTSIVKGDQASCSAAGVRTLKGTITNKLFTSTGGIGFVVYDSAANNAEGVITKLEVSVAN
jgi:hypothetical protein